LRSAEVASLASGGVAAERVQFAGDGERHVVAVCRENTFCKGGNVSSIRGFPRFPSPVLLTAAELSSRCFSHCQGTFSHGKGAALSLTLPPLFSHHRDNKGVVALGDGKCLCQNNLRLSSAFSVTCGQSGGLSCCAVSRRRVLARCRPMLRPLSTGWQGGADLFDESTVADGWGWIVEHDSSIESLLEIIGKWGWTKTAG
jgi:hypothetical protein